MKATGNILALGLTLLMGTTVMAGQHGIQPVPEIPAYSAPTPQYSPAPAYHGSAPAYHAQAPTYGSPVHHGHGDVYEYQEVELFNRVKYKDHDEMAPCAVTKVVQVNAPRRSRGCHGPNCVFVEICIPGGACEKVKVSKGGDRVRYDYGDYKVDVRVKKGHVEVDYQD